MLFPRAAGPLSQSHAQVACLFVQAFYMRLIPVRSRSDCAHQKSIAHSDSCAGEGRRHATDQR